MKNNTLTAIINISRERLKGMPESTIATTDDDNELTLILLCSCLGKVYE